MRTFEEKVEFLKLHTEAKTAAQVLQEAVDLYEKILNHTGSMGGWMLVVVGGHSSNRIKLADRLEKRGGFPGKEGNVILNFNIGGES